MILIIEPVEAVKDLWKKYIHWAASQNVKRLIATTPLIDGYEHVALSYHELQRIHAAYRKCKLLGHMWEIDHIYPGLPYTYISKCGSCFPHIHSQHTVQSYNLFAITERDED